MYAKFVGHRWLCATTVAVLVLAGWNAATFAQEKKVEPPLGKDVVDLAKETANLSTFSMLLEKAGLIETLKEKGPYTVFAPTDEALAKLGKEKLEQLQKPENKLMLQRILKNHVLAHRRTAMDLVDIEETKTLAGEHLRISMLGDDVKVGQAGITTANIPATNALMHVIDAVLMPVDG